MHSIKLIVVWGFLAGRVIGLYFIEKNVVYAISVKGEHNRLMITNFFGSELNNIDTNDMWFQ